MRNCKLVESLSAQNGLANLCNSAKGVIGVSKHRGDPCQEVAEWTVRTLWDCRNMTYEVLHWAPPLSIFDRQPSLCEANSQNKDDGSFVPRSMGKEGFLSVIEFESYIVEANTARLMNLERVKITETFDKFLRVRYFRAIRPLLQNPGKPLCCISLALYNKEP